MRKLATVLLTFLKLDYANKVIFGTSVTDKLTKNASMFTDLPVTIVILKQNTADLSQAVSDRIKSGPQAQAHLITMVGIWNANFKETAKYIDRVAKGNEETIAASGFSASKTQVAAAVGLNAMAEVQELSVYIPKGKKSSFTANGGVKKAAKGHVFIGMPIDAVLVQNGETTEITIGDKTIYIQANTSGDAVFNNVTSKVPLNVTVFSFNASGSGPAADPKEITPQ